MSETSDTVVRAFELPLQRAARLEWVAGRQDRKASWRPAPGSGEEVWPLIRQCWEQSSILANWCARWILTNDAVRLPEMPSLPPPSIRQTDLYQDALSVFRWNDSGCWWAGASGSVSAIVKDVWDYWFKKPKGRPSHRYRTLWLNEERPPYFSAPYPFPIRGQEWKAAGWESGKAFVDVNLPSATPREPVRARLYLRTGRDFVRQTALFRQVASGGMPRLELVIREQNCSKGCHRPKIGGGKRVLIKMAARLPVHQCPGSRVVTLCTDPGAFWVAELNGQPAWVANADHVRRAMDWLAAHEARRQRLSQDGKAEVRCTSRRQRAWQQSLARCCRKHARRMKSWLHEMASHAVSFAVRQKAGELCYDDSKREGMPLFPWFNLKKLLADKCAAAGITFHDLAHAIHEQDSSDACYEAALAGLEGE